MLIVPKVIPTIARNSVKPLLTAPMTITAPSRTMPWIALVADIRGVCSVLGTREIT